MLKKKILFLFFVLFIGSWQPIYSQLLPIFKMPSHTDTTVTICKGEFRDSDAGVGQTYVNLARDTFRICTGGIITLSFLDFQLETNGGSGDELSFYNGNTISPATLIGKFIDNNIPTGIVANGCLTIVFKSDFTAQNRGWVARWTSTVVPPVPPNISISPTPNCSTTFVDIALSKYIKCDSVYAAAFKLTGPITPIVTAANALGCVGDSTNNVRLQLSTNLTQSCNYNVAFTINMPDNCDSIWTFTVNNSFTIYDCPLTVNIKATPNDTICAGGNVKLEAILNSCLSYNYYWSHALSNASTHTVSPPTTTTYTLGVQSTSAPITNIYTSSITITVINPKITPPVNNPLCQSDAPFNLTAVPPGGTWRGKGITDSIQGTFDPDTAGQGTHAINYSLNGLCSDAISLTVLPMDAGKDEAACPSASAFSLSGFTPAGGIWSGYSDVTSGGVFNPTTPGTYSVTYTYSNGCSDFKQVFVAPIVISNATDTICQSSKTYTMTVSPPGGRWVPAPGIIDTIYGVIDPSKAGAGFHNYYYKLHGCMDTAHIYVKPIFAGWDFAYCPSQPLQTITPATPAGGIWSSGGTNNNKPSGLVNDSLGTYNPGIQGFDFTDTLIYTAPNGCTDTVLDYISKTNIIKDSLFFCDNQTPIKLDWNSTKNYPWPGVWSGSGVTKVVNDYYFNPTVAGKGIHTITYTSNTCSDFIKMVVYPSKLSYSDTIVCNTRPAFILDPIGLNANWKGQGIVNSLTGLFDPDSSGLGTFPISYTNKGGCSDTINVTVYLFKAAKIGGLITKYCYTNTDFPVSLVPAGGKLIGTGIVANKFNPSKAGAGQHKFVYSYGTGPCYTVDSIILNVSPPITSTVTVTNNPICKGDGAKINVVSSGGDPTVVSQKQTWSHGLFSTNTHVVSPVITTTYTITSSDGCSDNKIDTVRIIVNPDFSLKFTTSPINCNGTNGTASVDVMGMGAYSYSWSTTPIQTGNFINGISGASYSIRVTDIATDCFHDSLVTIPGYGLISSLFSVNPNLPCIPFTQNTVTFIDLSLGATHGFWELSNGDTVSYIKGINPKIVLTQPGEYKMKLHVENIGNCPSDKSIDLCLLDPVNIFVPDIFSPNGDGLNDVFFVRGKGIRQLSFIIYDRWGEKVFETTSPEIGWNGTYNGKEAEAGVYVWYLNATLFDDTTINQKGDVSLVR
jgi:gliding motility-associated-like protein